MASTRSSTAIGFALALVSAAGCRQDEGEGKLHAQLAALEREAEGLRESVAKLERGEAVLPDDAVVVSISEDVVKDFLTAQLPFDADAGSFKVTLTEGEAVFRGSPAVSLRGTIAPSEHPDLIGEIAAKGALENIRVEGETGTLRATIALDHVDLVQVAGLEQFIPDASRNELARTVRMQLAGHLPELQIPVRIEQAVELPSVTDGPVRIRGARMPLEVTIAGVFTGRGLLWIAVRVVPGELARTPGETKGAP
jgi:hypothetical protein